MNNLERGHQLASLSREIATLVAEMTVDPATKRKHTVGMVEKAMTEIGYSTRADKTAKAQALDLIRQLSQPDSVLPVERVRMRVRITMPAKDAKRIKDKLMELVEETEEEEMDAEWETVSYASPSELTSRLCVSTLLRSAPSPTSSETRPRARAASSRWAASVPKLRVPTALPRSKPIRYNLDVSPNTLPYCKMPPCFDREVMPYIKSYTISSSC